MPKQRRKRGNSRVTMRVNKHREGLCFYKSLDKTSRRFVLFLLRDTPKVESSIIQIQFSDEAHFVEHRNGFRKFAEE